MPPDQPPGSTYPAVVMIHGGGWDTGDKRTAFMRDRALDLSKLKNLVVLSINFRMTCAVDAQKPLCQGSGHGTEGTVTEAVDDAQDAVLFIRNPANAAMFRVDTTKGVGALGISSGGLQAADLAVKGTEGQSRVDAAVTWSGAMHLELVPPGEPGPHPGRERLVGCPYEGACIDGWDDYSPYHSCCTPGNVTSATPLLMFNSNDEFLPVEEPNQMYTLLTEAPIPVTKVILNSAGHAFYWNRVVNTGPPERDRISTNEDPEPAIDGKQVWVATADYFLSHL